MWRWALLMGTVLAGAMDVAALPAGRAPEAPPQAIGTAGEERKTNFLTPILLDTDIGTDIDDAFALALVMRSPELELLGVTTVSGDTAARARLAAKLLWESGSQFVPVAAGKPGKPLPQEQTRWADGLCHRGPASGRRRVPLGEGPLRRPGERPGRPAGGGGGDHPARALG